MTDKSVHPLRRKHRRGKRGGKKKTPLQIAASPEKLSSLRKRLALISKPSTTQLQAVI